MLPRRKGRPRRKRVDDRRTDTRQGLLYGKGPRRARTPQLCGRHRPVPARPVQHDVRDASVDHPSVRRLLDRRREQRLLPPQPRIGAEGSFGGVRPRHPPRLRRRPSARGGRRGQGGRFDMLRGGHESALRRHSARPDVRIDDDERRRAPGTGLLHRLWARTGRPSRPDGRHDTERHPQGVHGAQHLHLPARILHADYRRHLRIHGQEHAQVQLHLHFRLPHAGGGGDGRHRAGLYAGRRSGVHPRRYQCGHDRGPVRAAPFIFLGRGHEPLHGNRQDACRKAPVG